MRSTAHQGALNSTHPASDQPSWGLLPGVGGDELRAPSYTWVDGDAAVRAWNGGGGARAFINATKPGRFHELCAADRVISVHMRLDHGPAIALGIDAPLGAGPMSPLR